MKITTLKNPSRKPYIYKVTNLETHQYYIGSQCRGKIVGHNYFTSSTNKGFKEDFKNYGEEKYKIEIIKKFEDPKECVRAENYLIRDHMLLKDGLCLNRFYCCNNKKIFSTVGTHLSEETKRKMSTAHKGISRSEETRKKMGIAKKGLIPWNKGIPGWNKGIPCSEETRQKLSIARLGTHLSEETRQKLSIARSGIPSPRRIKISIEGTAFDSIAEASKYYKVAIPTIRYWAQKKQHNTVYIEK